MSRRQKIWLCPKCKSRNVGIYYKGIYYSGGIKYECKDCGAILSFVLEIEEEI